MTQKFQPHRKGSVWKSLTVDDSRFRPKFTHRRFDKHASVRLPTPDCSDPHTISTDVFRRCTLCDHCLRRIGERNQKSLGTAHFSPATVHDVGLFLRAGFLMLGVISSASKGFRRPTGGDHPPSLRSYAAPVSQPRNQANTCIPPRVKLQGLGTIPLLARDGEVSTVFQYNRP